MRSLNSSKVLRELKQALLDFSYPHFCVHCSQSTETHSLCSVCLDLLEPIDPSERCHSCFAESKSRYCNHCLSQELPFDKMAGVFDYMGPASSLVKKMKYSNQPWQAESMGAWMAHYFYSVLRWPIPDFVIPTPIAWSRKLSRGYNQSRLIAEALGRYIDVPVVDLLRRRIGDYSQARLSKEKRVELTSRSFFLKKAETLYDRTVLLVDDVATTGKTLRCCAEVLLEGCPASIYALTFCCARERN